MTKKNTISIAVLGPEYTFSDIAAKINFPDEKIAYFNTIDDIFTAVENKTVNYGLIPLENILNGTVRESFDNLYERKVHMIAKINLPIKHALVALPGIKKKHIKTIISHTQALGQCRKFIRQKFPDAQLISVSSTVAGYEKVKTEKDKNSAVILPLQTAKLLKLNILKKDIGDYSLNKTYFAVIKKGDLRMEKLPGNSRKCETMIAFHFKKDRPGLLLKLMQKLAQAKVNLTRIESRPAKTKAGNYIFYLDFKGDPADKKILQILRQLKKNSKKLKVLGVTLS